MSKTGEELKDMLLGDADDGVVDATAYIPVVQQMRISLQYRYTVTPKDEDSGERAISKTVYLSSEDFDILTLTTRNAIIALAESKL